MELAWYELVEEATKELPILLVKRGEFVSGKDVTEILTKGGTEDEKGGR